MAIINLSNLAATLDTESENGNVIAAYISIPEMVLIKKEMEMIKLPDCILMQ